jgi:UDP-glucose 4-epimerase
MLSKFLITGGAGFVGGNLVRYLLANSDVTSHVTILDNFSTKGSLENAKGIKDEFKGKVTLIKNNLYSASSKPELFTMVKKHDYIMHLATCDISQSSINPEQAVYTNIHGTREVLEACKKYEKRLFYASSASVYGNQLILPIPEDTVLHPLSMYAVTKLTGEQLCLLYHDEYNVQVSIGRYSNVYGPNYFIANPYSGLITKLLALFKKGKIPQSIEVKGDGSQTRDYVHVSDIIYASMLILFSPRAIGEIFNIGTGIETSVNQVINLFRETFDVRVYHTSDNHIDNIRRRSLNAEKIRSKLKWTPTVSLKNGIDGLLRNV